MGTKRKVRKHGTVETVAGNWKDRIDAIREVVTNCQYAKIDGVMMDLFSANAICQVFDALNDDNKVKFAANKAPIMAKIAFKIMSERS